MFQNDGSGLLEAIRMCSPLLYLNAGDDWTSYRTHHPLMVLSLEKWNMTYRVVDAAIDTCSVVVSKESGDEKELFFNWNGQLYLPGCVLEDGLVIPCIWEE